MTGPPIKSVYESVDDSDQTEPLPHPKTSKRQDARAVDGRSRRKAGAPAGNSNRVTHGLRASRLPDGNKFIEGQVASFRRQLWAELEASYGVGNVPLMAQALVQSCCRHEQKALLAARWLRKEDSKLSPEQRLAFLNANTAASEARDKCLRSLGLNLGLMRAAPSAAASDEDLYGQDWWDESERILARQREQEAQGQQGDEDHYPTELTEE
jgi:hypothetical protein